MGKMLDLACQCGCPSAQNSQGESSGSGEDNQAQHVPDSKICALLDAMCKVEEVLSETVEWLHKGSKMSADTIGLMEQIATVIHAMAAQQQQHTMFAELRDYIADFRMFVLEEVESETGIMNWDELAMKLRKEARDPNRNGQTTTDSMKRGLHRLGFTWEDWLNLYTLSSHAVGLFHQGRHKGYEATLSRLRVLQLPVNMQEVGQQGCMAAARKVIEFLKSQP